MLSHASNANWELAKWQERQIIKNNKQAQEFGTLNSSSVSRCMIHLLKYVSVTVGKSYKYLALASLSKQNWARVSATNLGKFNINPEIKAF